MWWSLRLFARKLVELPVLFGLTSETWVMSEPCRKCKGWRPLPGDTWCVACSAWETIGLELCGDWQGPVGLRSVANDLVLSCAREVRALRSLGAGLGRAPEVRRAETPARGPPGDFTNPPPVVATTAKAKAENKASAPSEYTYEESEESEAEEGEAEKAKESRPALPRRVSTGSAGQGSAGQSKPGTPVKEEKVSEERRSDYKRKGRDRSEEKRDKKRDHDNRSQGHRGEEKERKEKDRREKDKDKKKKKKKKRRGGRKHQQLYKLAEDPFRPHHRKLPRSILEEREELWLAALWIQWQKKEKRGSLDGCI